MRLSAIRSGRMAATILKYDLEDNVPAGDNPGFWSEASVDTLLWDLYDDHSDTGDEVQYPFSLIWAAFTDLKNDRFVYFPYFLERFLARSPESAPTLQAMAQLRSIDFQPQIRPSVSMPFPKPINVGDSAVGYVDSLTSRRTNLMQSSHFFTFTTTGGAAAIRLDITGLGPSGNVNANDLDLFLMDTNGRLVNRSDRGLNGQSELHFDSACRRNVCRRNPKLLYESRNQHGRFQLRQLSPQRPGPVKLSVLVFPSLAWFSLGISLVWIQKPFSARSSLRRPPG